MAIESKLKHTKSRQNCRSGDVKVNDYDASEEGGDADDELPMEEEKDGGGYIMCYKEYKRHQIGE
jgi:hypothetical protein